MDAYGIGVWKIPSTLHKYGQGSPADLCGTLGFRALGVEEPYP